MVINTNASSQDSQQGPKALIIRLSSLGDIVMATAVLPILTKAGFSISFVAKPAFQSLLENHPDIQQVHCYDTSDSENTARQQFFAWVKAERFDVILDLHDTMRTWGWRHFLRQQAPLFIAKKDRFRELLLLLFRIRSLGYGRGGRARLFQSTAIKAVQSCGFARTNDINAPPLSTSLGVFEPANALPQDFIGIVTGSAWKSKQWPLHKFAALIQQIDRPIVLLGSKSDLAAESLLSHSTHPKSISFIGRTSLQEATNIIAKALLVVGNDTGLIHIAEAVRTPCISIEGPTHPDLGYSIYRPKNKIAALDLACRPCSKTGKICWRFGLRTCLNDLKPTKVKMLMNERIDCEQNL